MISTNFISDILSLILTKNVFSNLFCTLVYNLKSNYAKTLSRNDVKNIVNTGFYTLGDSFCVFVTAGAKGKFFGEFDISGFCETQKGARKKPKVRYISINIITDLLEAIREPSVAANKYKHTTFSLMSADKEEISKMHTTTKETVIVIHELKY